MRRIGIVRVAIRLTSSLRLHLLLLLLHLAIRTVLTSTPNAMPVFTVTAGRKELRMLCDRREFLAQMAALSASLAVGGVACRKTTVTSSNSAFVDAEWIALQALVEHMLPGDQGPQGYEPGAKEAGCADFVSVQLGQKQFTALHGLVRKGLHMLTAQAQKQAGQTFADLDQAGREQALRAVHKLRQRGFHGGRFVQVLLVLILEGFLSDPKHGGNRDAVGWKFANFKPVRWGPDDGRGSDRPKHPGAMR